MSVIKRIPSAILLVLALLAPCACSWAAENDLRELQAAYFLNFIMYTSWPTPDTSGKPLDIRVLRDEVVASALAGASDKTVHERPLSIRLCQSPAELAGADAVFVPAESASALTDADWRRFGPGALVVSDDPGTLERGATIQLLTVAGKLRFRISLRTATDIELSSKILTLALEVRK